MYSGDHPDKVCDQISDALLDAYMAEDAGSRCGIETVGGKGTVFITGEVTSSAAVDVEAVVRGVLAGVGYDGSFQVIDNIGKAKPLAIYCRTDKGCLQDPQAWYEECKPQNIIVDLGLRSVRYEETARFGHFGNPDFAWEEMLR